LVFINNFYPANYDDKCLPWTWFVACYFQLSVALPLFVAFYNILSRTLRSIIFGALIAVFFGINFALI